MRLIQCLVAIFASASVLLNSADAHSTQRNPLNHLTIVDEPVIHTPSHRVHSFSTFDLTFLPHGENQRIKLRLSPNHDVIAEGATVQYMAPDGTIRSTEYIDRSEHKVFKGEAFVENVITGDWTHVGWARVMVHQDGVNPIFEGAFRVENNHHHIQTRVNYLSTKHLLDPAIRDSREDVMVVWKDSDLAEDEDRELKRSLGEDLSCSANELSFNQQQNGLAYTSMSKREPSFWDSTSTYTRKIFGRQLDNSTTGNSGGINLINSIGNTAGCFTTRKIALVGVATDCTYTGAFNSSASARANIINQMNSASVQYENSFNISLGIQNLTISDAACPATAPSSAMWNVPCTSSLQIQDRLNLFAAWRGLRPDTNSHWTLLSTCNTGSAVGLAWLGQSCVNTATVISTGTGNETVSGANIVVRVAGSEWQILAHETGHTFGAVHDCTSTTCNDGTSVASQACCPLSSTTCDAGQQFLMNPTTGSGISRFSPCSIGQICTSIGKGSIKTTCLSSNKNVQVVTGQECGNGIVEAGEDCDCGGTAGCGTNSCCNPTTCKFIGAAVCDPSNEECCTGSCQFAGNGTVCRTSSGTCDPAETCTGTSATCPVDVTAPDGTGCSNGNTTLSGLTCSSGQCTSRDLQCQTVMGTTLGSNSTYACQTSGCAISCTSPQFGSNVCYQMQQNFLDGTTCGGGGKCASGQCQGSTVGGQISSWVSQNKPLVIGLSAGLGSVLVLAILSCLVSCCRRSRRRRLAPAMPPNGARVRRGPPGPGPYQQGGVYPPYPQYDGAAVPLPPPPMAQRGYGARWNIPPQPPVYSGQAVRYA